MSKSGRLLLFSRCPCLPHTADRTEATSGRIHCQGGTPQRSHRSKAMSIYSRFQIFRDVTESPKKKKTEGSVLLWKGAGTAKPQREKLEGGRGKPRTSYHTALHYFITFKRVEQSPVTDFSIFTRLFQNLPVSLYSLQTKAQFRAESIIFHPKDFPRLTEPHMAM